MTEEEAFKHGAAHLLHQNAKSISDDGKCAYRGAEGRRCAAGAFIPDEHYCPSMEGRVWSGGHWKDSLVHKQNAPETHAQLITELQEIHDDFREVRWGEELEKLACRRGLEKAFEEVIASLN
jgi:hypothetical protein